MLALEDHPWGPAAACFAQARPQPALEQAFLPYLTEKTDADQVDWGSAATWVRSQDRIRPRPISLLVFRTK